MADLSAVIVEAGDRLVECLPLLDRIKFRRLSRDALRKVDGSMIDVKSLCLDRDLPLNAPGHQLEALLWLSIRCPNLQVLSMSDTMDVEHRLRYGCRPWEPPKRPSESSSPNWSGQVPTIVMAINSVGRRLFNLFLWDLKNISSFLFRFNGQAVHHLDLGKTRPLTDQHVTAIAQGCPKLLTLDVSHCPGVTNVGVAAVGENCHLLRCLNVSFCGDVGDRGLSVVAEGCPDLRQLFAAYARVSNACYSTLVKFGITLSAFSIPRAWVPRPLCQLAPLLSRWPMLQHLDLSWCRNLRSFFFIHNRNIEPVPLRLAVIADNCPDLRYLDVSGLCVQKQVVALAPKCPELRTVLMESTFATDDDVAALATHCRHLHTLDVSYTGVQDGAIQELARMCPMLESLAVTACHNVSDNSLMAIVEHCAYFHELSWAGSAITEKGIQQARQLYFRSF
eukprot:jgi/Mesvir1/14834/Mv05460-RA.1